jgi:hypothetical protein
MRGTLQGLVILNPVGKIRRSICGCNYPRSRDSNKAKFGPPELYGLRSIRELKGYEGRSRFSATRTAASRVNTTMSRRTVKPTVFHDDSRSSDAGSVVAPPVRTKPRTNREPARDLLALQNDRVSSQQNGYPNTGVKGPLLGPEGEIQVCSQWLCYPDANKPCRLISMRFRSRHC